MKKNRTSIKVRIIAAAAAIAAAASLLAALFIFRINNYKADGTISAEGLKQEVRICRDEKNMAYIYAENLQDAVFAMGFATAQDRLFQMELSKRLACGRISEVIGQEGKQTDRMTRTLGFKRNAARHAEILTGQTRRLLQWYVNGINEFIENHEGDHHTEFSLAGIDPEPWEITDSLALFYYMGWNSAGNLDTEIMARLLTEKFGHKRAQEIFPLNRNPAEENKASIPPAETGMEKAGIKPEQILADQGLGWLTDTGRGPSVGSNNWAVSPQRSESGAPVVANDPHLDTRLMPGPWYPCALILPDRRIAGATVPGIPAVVAGRTNNIALGITNSYGDAQDLYIESLDPHDPDRYMEGNRSIPFDLWAEKIKIKDKTADGGFREENIIIRTTRRGPVVSGVLAGLDTDHVMTLRWSPFESMTPSLGIRDLLFAETVDDVKKALSSVTTIMLNFVFADTEGNIGWQTTGRLPVRTGGENMVPAKVKDSSDDWKEWIPYNAMPQRYNPEKQWLGTCNHKTVSDAYPYYISSQFAPSYRYERLEELMEGSGKLCLDDHWNFQRDTKNPMAEKIAPVMAESLAEHRETSEMAELLENWDYRESSGSAAPAVFQAVYREFLFHTFADELGGDLMERFAENPYFWKERLEQMVLSGDSAWFDDTGTEKQETMDEIFYRAGLSAESRLKEQLGASFGQWQWGDIHELEFVSPVMRSGFLKNIFGGGSHPMGGSAETLYRTVYSYNNPFDVTISASLRMVADLGDPDKVAAVLPCGVTGRQFHRHSDDQTEAFMKGEKLYWWFSDKMIEKHKKKELVLQSRD